jgi:membrane associated rhomboid family serine protease
MSFQPEYLLVTVAFYAAFAAIMLAQRARAGRRERPLPVAPLAVFVVTAVVSLLQFPFPAILDALKRDPERLAAGEWWRLLTPLVVQDGGWAGTVSNLVALALVGTAAAAQLGVRRWLLLYFGTGIATEVAAYAWLPQGFAGNSIAICGLAAGLAWTAVTATKVAPAILGGVSVASGVALLVLRDLHGVAYAIGLILADLSWRLTRD